MRSARFATVIFVVVLVVMCLVVGLANCDDHDYTCARHGKLTTDNQVVIQFAGAEYRACANCVIDFIMANSDEVGRLIKDAQRLLERGSK